MEKPFFMSLVWADEKQKLNCLAFLTRELFLLEFSYFTYLPCLVTYFLIFIHIKMTHFAQKSHIKIRSLHITNFYVLRPDLGEQDHFQKCHSTAKCSILKFYKTIFGSPKVHQQFGGTLLLWNVASFLRVEISSNDRHLKD